MMLYRQYLFSIKLNEHKKTRNPYFSLKLDQAGYVLLSCSFSCPYKHVRSILAFSTKYEVTPL